LKYKAKKICIAATVLLSLAGSANAVYVDGNPLHLSDPSGLAPGDPYPSQPAAARQAISDVIEKSITQNREYGGMVYRMPNGSYSYTNPQIGNDRSVNPGGPEACPVGTYPSASYHTHGAYDPAFDDENFSISDKIYARKHGIDGYLGTPSSALKHYNQSSGVVTELPPLRRRK
jgi:hypothetical protein